MKRKSIVIIEDSNVVVSIYRAKLQGAGFDIHAGGDGEAGLALVRRLRPDLVMLDLTLPKMGGVEVLRCIRATPELEKVPVYVLSGTYRRETVEEAWSAGATQVLSKAADTPNHVVEILREALAAG